MFLNNVDNLINGFGKQRALHSEHKNLNKNALRIFDLVAWIQNGEQTMA